MGKFLASLIVSALLVGLGVVVYGLEVVPLLGSPLVTVAFAALLSSVVGLASAVVFLIISGVLSLAVFAIDKSLGTIVLILVFLLLFVFGHPYVITKMVIPRVEWFPAFSYWQFFSVMLISTIFSGLYSNSTSDDD